MFKKLHYYESFVQEVDSLLILYRKGSYQIEKIIFLTTGIRLVNTNKILCNEMHMSLKKSLIMGPR